MNRKHKKHRIYYVDMLPPHVIRIGANAGDVTDEDN